MNDAEFRSRLRAALERGTSEHYADAIRYEHEYGRRRDDINWYLHRADKVRTPILELGCGSGRLLVPLVKAGHRVVGVDLSAAMLAHCRDRLAELPRDAHERATLRRGDFRHVRLGQRFRLIVCPFNAFQHLYELKDIEDFFATVDAHLAKDGVLIFDLMQPDLKWLSRDSTKRWSRTRFKDPVTGARMEYSTNHVYDDVLQIAFMRIYYRHLDGKPREKVVHLSHRHFFPQELLALVHYNNFCVRERFGDFFDGPPMPESDQQILVCERKTTARVTRSLTMKQVSRRKNRRAR